jgi:ABC-2 type transport system ATP-binding protein
VHAVGDASGDGVRVERGGPEELTVFGMGSAEVGRLAHCAGIELHELAPARDDLEQIFFTLTRAPEEPARHA